MPDNLRQSAFFDFLNRREESNFERFVNESLEDVHYINWNQFVLPQDYGDAETEYHAIRNSCALFDVSPIRKIRIAGIGAGAFLDRLLTRPVSTVAPMRACYVVFCNNDGSLKDDAILYKYDADDYLLMPSDIDHSAYFETVCQRYSLSDVSFTECTDEWVGLAIQGPMSAAVLLRMGFEQVQHLEPYSVRDYALAGGLIRISRMGFTADLGYECWIRPDSAAAFIESIESVRFEMDIELPGYGLRALDACRLEGGFIVAGWDFATEIEPQPGFERSPFELNLGWLVDLDAADFVGRDALIEQKKNGCEFTLRNFKTDFDRELDDGAMLHADDGESDASIGSVNCSSWSWGMQKTIGNASIKSEYAELETAWLAVDSGRVKVDLGRGPLLTLERRNQVPAP